MQRVSEGGGGDKWVRKTGLASSEKTGLASSDGRR